MKRWRYSIGLKAAVVAVNQVLAVVFVVCLMVLAVLYQRNILNFHEKLDIPYESSSYFSEQFKSTAIELLEFVNLRRKFETDGSYDPEKLVDVWHYYERQEIMEDSGKKSQKDALLYKLGDLAEWARNYRTSSYEFVSEYEIGKDIQQRQTVIKNGESIYSDEKTVQGLADMTPELRDNIIENVEYYYGGSYSRSSDTGFIDYSTEDLAYTGVTETKIVDETSLQEIDVASAGTEGQESSDMDGEAIIQKVLNGQLYELSAEELKWLLLSMENMEFVSSSSFYDFVDEDYLPQDGDGIWEDFINGRTSMERMQNAFRALGFTLDQIGQELAQYRRSLNTYHKDVNGTNVSYWIKQGKDGAAYTNIRYSKPSAFPVYGQKLGKYWFYQESDINLDTNVAGMEDYFYQWIEPNYGNKGSMMFVGVNTKYPKTDAFLEAKRQYNQMHPWIRICMWGAGTSLVLLLICFIYLSIVAGKRDDSGTVHLNVVDRIHTEFLLLLTLMEIIIFAWAMVWLFSNFDGAGFSSMLPMGGGITFVGMVFLLLFYLSFVRRIRAGVLWSGSILCWFIRGIGLLFTSRKSYTKMLIWFGLHLLACLVILPMISVYSGQEFTALGILLFLILSGVEAVQIIREGVQRNKVLEGISKISSGDLEYKIAEEELNGDNRKLAQAVNDIGEGLHRAVDASMKNERLQADLITNVSHDIKTPLTSIINYVDLLKREKLDNERACGYIAVLDAKSQRLKQLAEDLVEASRISSGNIKLEMERINLVELVHQTEGEFAERFEARKLNVVSNIPRESVVILADGRRIWRVLENLFNNVAKYAMEHTRVYVDMQADGRQVLFSIKNISENPLNIQADELTERFIRGDISRSTEGSGLGLSIAKNLMLLMGGTFEIYLDGDLFKVMIGFKQEPEHREILLEED